MTDPIEQAALLRKAVDDGYCEWARKPHNEKWVRKIDGTPIPNDLVACIQGAVSRAALAVAASEAKLAVAVEEIKSGPRTKLALIEADNASLIAIANASRQHNADLRDKLDKAEEYSLELMHMIRDTADMNIQLRLKLAAVVEALEWQADQSEAHPFMAKHARAALAQIKGDE